MRAIRQTKRFKRDYGREESGRHGKTLEAVPRPILELLVVDKPLPQHNFDHPLAGDWVDHRDCHIKPDLILIYRKPDNEHLDLVRLGSHSELGL